MFTEKANAIFNRAIADYHLYDDVDHHFENPYEAGSLEALLYDKNMVDTVQWHLEDIIRDPAIDPVEALAIKRRIDRSNQVRTDMVEYIDSYWLDKFKDVAVAADARINTETPAWAIDRLSILALKIYHMRQETERRAGAPRRMRPQARHAALAAGRPLDGHRRAVGGHSGRPQVYEDLQTDEDVQRSGA